MPDTKLYEVRDPNGELLLRAHWPIVRTLLQLDTLSLVGMSRFANLTYHQIELRYFNHRTPEWLPLLNGGPMEHVQVMLCY